MPEKLRAALYARVSTKDKGQNPENQLIPLRQRAKDRGWSVVREYVEQESAAGRVRRHQYLTMLKDAESKQYDVLAFWSLDRFSREGAAQTLSDLQRLTNADVLWVSLQDPIPDEPGPVRDMIIAIMASLARLETERRSERMRAAIKRKRAEGGSWGRKRRNIPDRQLLQLVSKGYSQAAIARHFNVSRGTIVDRINALSSTSINDPR